MLEDIVFKSQNHHHQEITKTPPFHSNSAACLPAPSLAREPEIKSTHTPSLTQRKSTTRRRKKKEEERRKGSQ
jgi:hypothetical protein